MATRVGVDVGGTFTDLVFYDDETGEVRVGKGSTTPASPDEGVRDVLAEAVGADSLAAASYFLHGTTVGINSLLERKGAVVGLLTTRGFRDVLETRRGDRERMYDLLWKPDPPLVPRRLRLPVTERVRADGSIETPFHAADVAAAVEVFEAEGVESVAVVFINAYADPEHELLAVEALRSSGFDGEISLSHQVSGEYREYERSSTTVVDAYVRPRVSSYLRRLEDTLQGQGFDGEFLITRSGGGAMTFAEAEARPFETIMSGPVAGAVGGGELCRELGIEQAITADVGGTSFDTCLIVDGRPQVKYEGNVVGMPIQSPWVDVRSIGAGGGSVAYIDAGLLRVGPRSAGADPGPVCYGRGGTEPAVTDAAASLGMLAFGELAGGVALDIDASRAALHELGRELALDVDGVSRGVITIANAAMANAIRSITVEQGQDPRTASLIAFGGAGPLFGTLLARELEITSVVVPNYAGNFSAWGLLGQDVTRSAALTAIRRLDEAGLEGTNAVLRDLFASLERRGTSSPDGSSPDDSDVQEAALDLRYVGQEYTLTIGPPSENGAITAAPAAIAELFTESYDRTFGHTLSEPIEIAAVRATKRIPLARKTGQRTVGVLGSAGEERELEAYSFTRGEPLTFAVLKRGSLAAGAQLQGPVIVLEETATTYVDAGFDLEVNADGTLILSDAEAA
ncbi:MAG: hydantoinase/oxoprolinase family protein [Actinomycetia bacterium]|nr:hydantoinase/oxoprolinase family protein [Actinomycetes bacterium]